MIELALSQQEAARGHGSPLRRVPIDMIAEAVTSELAAHPELSIGEALDAIAARNR